MNPGVYLGMDRAQYDAIPFHNQSRLKKWIELGDIPSEFAYYQDHKDDENKECFLIGGALDCMCLEASEFDTRFAVAPHCDRRTKEGKALWSSFLEASKGKRVLTDDQNIAVVDMFRALCDNDSTKDVFKHCKKAALVADLFGFHCKGEIDLWNEKTEHIGDLKALKDVSPAGFSKAFFDYGYDIQATFYLNLAKALNLDKRIFDFHCVKNAPPYTVATYSFAPYDNAEHAQVAASASQRTGNAIHELDRRLKTNDFADDNDWKLIEIPGWRLRRAQLEMETVA